MQLGATESTADRHPLGFPELQDELAGNVIGTYNEDCCKSKIYHAKLLQDAESEAAFLQSPTLKVNIRKSSFTYSGWLSSSPGYAVSTADDKS